MSIGENSLKGKVFRGWGDTALLIGLVALVILFVYGIERVVQLRALSTPIQIEAPSKTP